jgi:hypothetical protein
MKGAAQVMDALKMDFADNSFDLVWGCESGEHIYTGAIKAVYIHIVIRLSLLRHY